MEHETVTYRCYLRPGEEQTVRDITASAGVFSLDEIDIAEELARENLERGAVKSGYHYIAADVHGDVVGYACYGPTPCTNAGYDLYWIVVSPHFSGSGIGLRLITLVEKCIVASCGRKIYIETSSREPYIPARRLYSKCRYRQEAVIQDFYDVGDHKLIYVKDLQSEI